MILCNHYAAAATYIQETLITRGDLKDTKDRNNRFVAGARLTETRIVFCNNNNKKIYNNIICTYQLTSLLLDKLIY